MTSLRCASCGYESDIAAEYVETQDPIGIKRLKERGKKVEPGARLCLKCSGELYAPGQPPVGRTVTCPRCGERIEIWL